MASAQVQDGVCYRMVCGLQDGMCYRMVCVTGWCLHFRTILACIVIPCRIHVFFYFLWRLFVRYIRIVWCAKQKNVYTCNR